MRRVNVQYCPACQQPLADDLIDQLEAVKVTAKERAVLEVLAHRFNKVVPLYTLIEYGLSHGGDGMSDAQNVLRTYVCKLRQKLGVARTGLTILNHCGVGYKLCHDQGGKRMDAPYIDIASLPQAQRDEIVECARRIPSHWNFRRDGPVKVSALPKMTTSEFIRKYAPGEAVPETVAIRSHSFEWRSLSWGYRATPQRCLVADGNIIVQRQS